MPHKRNPISGENLTGLSRLLRSYVVPALENCALWHERDISHSSVERVTAPDANILADYLLGRLYELLSGLEVFPEKMKENLESLHGVVFSQQLLLKLVEKGMSRDDAYKITQASALTALDKRQSLASVLEANDQVKKVLTSAEIKSIFDPNSFFGHIDYLYKKVLN
jgi:adenylosuccinate lyase